MNQEPEQSKDHVETIWTRRIFDGRYVGLLILGILFTIVWLGACVFFGFALAIVDTSGGNGNSIPNGWFTCIGIVQLIGLVSPCHCRDPGGSSILLSPSSQAFARAV